MRGITKVKIDLAIGQLTWSGDETIRISATITVTVRVLFFAC